jgi:hypothetical protein
MSGIDVEPEGRGFANEAPRLDNRIGLGDDPRQIGNFDGEASRFEIGGEDRPPSAAAELNSICRGVESSTTLFSSSRAIAATETATMTCPPDVASTKWRGSSVRTRMLRPPATRVS